MSDRSAWLLAFLADRLRPGASLGLLLTVQLVVLVAFGAAFGTVLEDVTENEDFENETVAEHDELTSIDAPVREFLIDARQSGLTSFFEIFTWVGSPGVLWPLLLLVGLVRHRVTRSWNPLIFLVVSLGGATTLSTLVKLVVARPRPPSMALVDAIGYAFPSGHATAAAAGWLSLALVLGVRAPRWSRVALLTGAVLLIGLVGLSRVYLGVHVLTDVLGGWSLGALWVVAVLVALRLLRSRKGSYQASRVR